MVVDPHRATGAGTRGGSSTASELTPPEGVDRVTLRRWEPRNVIGTSSTGSARCSRPGPDVHQPLPSEVVCTERQMRSLKTEQRKVQKRVRASAPGASVPDTRRSAIPHQERTTTTCSVSMPRRHTPPGVWQLFNWSNGSTVRRRPARSRRRV